MSTIKMIITDLDGTALQDHTSLHPLTKQALIEAREAGHHVLIATGRPARASLHFHKELGLTTPIINFNGAYIHHPHDDTFEEMLCEIPKERIFDLFASDIRSKIKNAFCEYKEHLYILDKHSTAHNFFHLDVCDEVFYGEFIETLDRHPTGFIIETVRGAGSEVVDYLRLNYKNDFSCRRWAGEDSTIIEVFHPDSNKGTAIQKIADHYGIDIEHVIAFGDAMNDYEMIHVAGTGVVMENGSDDVKQIANVLTKSNKEAGVAHYLYEHILVKK